jgi:ribosomal protein S24E
MEIFVSDLDFVFTRYERNEMYNRIEIDFIVHFSGGIPSRDKILDDLALFYSFEKETCALDRLRSRAGKQELTGTARIYDTAGMKRMQEKVRSRNRRP